MDATGKWKLAPAYDLTFSNTSHGMHSTTIAGEGKSPGAQHLLELATAFSMKNPKAIFNEVKSAVADWKIYAKDAGVSKNSTSIIWEALTTS